MKKKYLVLFLILIVILIIPIIILPNNTVDKNISIFDANTIDNNLTNSLDENIIKQESKLNIPAIINKDNVTFRYSDSNDTIILSRGDKIIILTDDKNINSYSVDYNGCVGYIEKNDISFFSFNENEKYSLALDISQFNIKEQGSTENPNDNFHDNIDFVNFIVKNNINYVYIRLGGRGWGKEGNMYYDTNASSFAEICDYLKIPYGFYFLDEALNVQEVLDEVNFVKAFLDDNSLKMNVLPLVLDLENQHGRGRTDNTWDNRIPLINKLVDEFSKININTLVYANGARIETYIKDANCKFWTAMYLKDNNIPTLDYKSFIIGEQERIKENPELLEKSCLNTELNLSDTQTTTYSNEYLDKVIGWQFTENGAINNGISEYIDLSIFDNDYFKQFYKKYF